MKGGQLVRGVTMCQTEGFHQFLSPEYWILYKLFAYKIGGGGFTSTPGLHPNMGSWFAPLCWCLLVSGFPDSPDRGGKSLWQFLLPFLCDKSIISIKCIHKKVHSTENTYINNTIKPWALGIIILKQYVYSL